MKLIRWTIISVMAVSAALTFERPACAQEKTERTAQDILVEGKMRRMTTVLMLNEEQKTKVRPVVAEDMKAANVIQEDASLSVAEKDVKKKEVREKMNAKLKEILTPEQYLKLEEMQKPQPKKSKPKPKAE